MQVGRIIKGTGIYFLGKIFYLVTNFVLMALLARWLEPQAFGVFSLTLSIIMALQLINDFGLNQTITFFIPSSKSVKETKSYLNYAFKIRLFIITLTSTLLIMFSGIISKFYNLPELKSSLIILSISNFSYSLITFFSSALIAFKRVGKAVLLEASQILPRIFAVLFLFLYGSYSVYAGFSFGFILSLIFGLTLMWFVYPKENGFSRINKKNFVKYSSFIYFGLIMMIFYNKLIPLILGKFADSSQVAFYGVSVSITSMIFLLSITLGSVLQPFITSSNKNDLKKNLPRFFKYNFIATIPLALLAILFSKELILFFYKKMYLPAVPSLIICSIASMLYGILSLWNNIALGFGKAKLFSKMRSLLAIISLIASLIFIPSLSKIGFGAIGASLVYLITCFFEGFYLYLKLNEKFFPYKYLLKSLIAGIIILPLVLLKNFFNGFLLLMLAGILGTISYVLVLFGLNYFDKEDKKFLKTIINKLTNRG